MRILRAIVAVTATLSLLFTTSMPVSADEIWFFSGRTAAGAVYGYWGIQYPETYDGDGIIAASVRDARTDGSCVSAIYRDGGRNYTQAVSCYQWADHLFYDQTCRCHASALVRVNRTRYNDPIRWRHISGY